jgi:hypothetical protein
VRVSCLKLMSRRRCLFILYLGLYLLIGFFLKFSSRLYSNSMIWRSDVGIAVEAPAIWHTGTEGGVYPSEMCNKQSKVSGRYILRLIVLNICIIGEACIE